MERTPRRVLGVLAGGFFPAERLAEWARSADLVLAADGGADRLLAVGISPAATVGDYDSVVAREGLGRIVRDPDQSTSDCDKLLDFAAREGIGEVTLVNLEGDRIDHVLGALFSAVRARLRVRLALGRGLGWVLTNSASVACDTQPGETVSLLPLVDCVGVRLSGVQWPLEGVTLSATGLVSLSNRATGSRIEAALDAGAALLTVLSPRLESPGW